MDIRIDPTPLTGSLEAIPSKSQAHRLLIAAALADGPTCLGLGQSSADIDATCRALAALGAGIRREGRELWVRPIASVPDDPLLDCGESGSTLRFLLPVAAALTPRCRFTGHGRLPERPLEELLRAMESHGVTFSARKLPLESRGLLQPGAYALPGNVSSQYITGLLLSLSRLSGESAVTLTTALESAGYVDITLHALRSFGVDIAARPGGWEIPAGGPFRSPGRLEVEGDWSNAAFFLAAGALGPGVTLRGLDAASPQGDRAIMGLLEALGAAVTWEDGSVRVAAAGGLRDLSVDMRPIPDALPILAVLATQAGGSTRFTHAGRLRLKESDRLTAVAAMLRALGGAAEEYPEELVVHGGPLAGGVVDGCGDHRIVMAAAVAASVCAGPVTIRGAEAVEKSYPDFFRDYTALGGHVHVI